MDTLIVSSRRPNSLKTRIALVDSIRGLAIFGILWVNIFLRSDPIQTSSLPQEPDFVNWVVALSGTLKFRSMFAFLFGFGMAMQARSAPDENLFLRTYLRRIAVLLLFGVLHIVFLWPGDILAMYAICAVLLVSFRRTSVKRLVVLTSLLLLVPVLQQLAGVRLFDEASLRADVSSGYVIYQQGTFWQITHRRVYDFTTFWVPSLMASFPGVFAMMLLGVVFERNRYLQRPEEHLAFWRRLCLAGYLIGIPANAIFATWKVSSAPSTAFALTAKIAHVYGAPILVLAYVATMVLLARADTWQPMFKGLASIGRMSLTAYLGHSAVCAVLFHAYGLGWFGSVGKWQDVGLAMGICLAELAFASAWFANFKMGPLEWIWRWATYGARPAMRYPVASAGASANVSL